MIFQNEYQTCQTVEITLQLFSLKFHYTGTNRTCLIAAAACSGMINYTEGERQKKRERAKTDYGVE